MTEQWQDRFFEDLEVGDVYRSRLGRTITQTHNTWFTALTMNTNQLHFDAEFARTFMVRKRSAPEAGDRFPVAELGWSVGSTRIIHLICDYHSSSVVASNEGEEHHDLEFRLPAREGDQEYATVQSWLKNVGDCVDAGELIVEVDTDKVTEELASPVTGTLAEIVAHEGDEVKVNALLAIIEES